ncbi:MAG: phosphatidylglycerophosphatase A, partial [Alphaproteobacteria bacterium]|nr:phosphatidylglycerophosphatase A [Alphaproteobacteria bacterium]
MKKSIAYLIATWFKSGLSPKAPGTVGSICSLPLAWFLATYAGTWGILWGTAIIFIIGWWAT